MNLNKITYDNDIRDAVRTTQTSKMELFSENSQRLQAVHYFRKKFHLRCLIGSNYASVYVTISFLKKLDEMNNTVLVYQLTLLYTFFINS